MARLRLQITKGKEIGYISHLDYARTVERAIRRAHLPAAYSEGFNPHMKLAFASALAVGVTSEAEYVDIELTGDVELTEAVKQLSKELPEGILIKGAAYMVHQTPALMAAVNLASYRIAASLLPKTHGADVKACVDAFNQDKEILYIKESPKKGKKEIDVKQYVTRVELDVKEMAAELSFTVNITPTGSIKPGEVLDALVTLYHLPVCQDSAVIERTGLYIVDGSVKRTPLA